MAKILIIRLTSLGDVIFTLPLVNTLAEENEVSYLVAEKGLGIIKNNPSIKNVHFVPLKEWRKNPFSIKRYIEFFKLIREIRKEKYDIALDCQQMYKSLWLFLLSGAKRRITFSDAREGSIIGGNEFIKPKAKFRDNNYHIVERNLDFARHLNIQPKEIKFTLPPSTNEVIEQVNMLTSTLYDVRKTVIISPATTWKNKYWSSDNWAKVIKAINQTCNIVFTGMKEDKYYIDEILSKTQERIDCLNLVGRTNFEELKELFTRADIVISPDSGSSNLAWACSKPAVITVFTCTPAKRFGPYGDNDKYFAIQGNLSCEPCFKKRCRMKVDNCACTNFPEADEIIKIVKKLLN